MSGYLSQVDAIIELLEKVRNKPLYYFSEGMYAVSNFLNGFNIACALLGVDIGPDEIYKSILEERGWKWSALAPLNEMADRGLSVDQITDELLIIQIQ